MINKPIEEIEKKYDLELSRIVNEVKKCKAKLVLLQFPDGLKQAATSVVDFLEKNTKETNAKFLIWSGSCYGACDAPIGLDKIKPKIDLTIQFGHNEVLPSY